MLLLDHVGQNNASSDEMRRVEYMLLVSTSVLEDKEFVAEACSRLFAESPHKFKFQNCLSRNVSFIFEPIDDFLEFFLG